MSAKSTDGAIPSEYERLGIHPTPDSGERLTDAMPWDESERPHRPESGADVEYSEQGRQVGKHLIDVHDGLRRELTELRLTVEHHAIHDAIEEVDGALVSELSPM